MSKSSSQSSSSLNQKQLGNLPINLILQVGIKFLAIGLGVFTMRWLNSNLAPEVLKSYNGILSYLTIILGLVVLGLPQIIQKYYTNETDKNKLANLWTTFFWLRGVSYLLGLVAILLTFPLSSTTNLGWIIGLFTVQFILIADMSYRSVCDALGRSWQFSLSDFLGKFSLIVFLYSFVWFFEPFLKLSGLAVSPMQWFIGASILAYLSAFAVDFFWQKPHTPFGKFDQNLLRSNWKPIAYLSLSTLVVASYLRTDILFLLNFGASDLQINGYANTYRLFEIASVVPGLTMPVLTSRVKKMLDQTDWNGKIKILRKWLGLVWLSGLVCSLLFWLLSPIALQILEPQKLYYTESLRTLLPFAASITLIFNSLFLGGLNILFGREKYELWSNLLNMVVALSAYFLLIPGQNIWGAALATLLVYVVDSLAKAYFFSRTLAENR